MERFLIHIFLYDNDILNAPNLAIEKKHCEATKILFTTFTTSLSSKFGEKNLVLTYSDHIKYAGTFLVTS